MSKIKERERKSRERKLTIKWKRIKREKGKRKGRGKKWNIKKKKERKSCFARHRIKVMERTLPFQNTSEKGWSKGSGR